MLISRARGSSAFSSNKESGMSPQQSGPQFLEHLHSFAAADMRLPRTNGVLGVLGVFGVFGIRDDGDTGCILEIACISSFTVSTVNDQAWRLNLPGSV